MLNICRYPLSARPPLAIAIGYRNLQAEPNRHQRKAARRAARLTAAKETPTSSHVNGAGGGSNIKGSHVGKEDNHAADMVAQSAAPVDVSSPCETVCVHAHMSLVLL